ncbi:kinase-like protein [Macroventuria anomochaeta]|uniref:Kinase-like protein n=1 Tax=Macroventuria anomochaeta TaxID=301207 RepID=A0ACB6SFJ6_9PLEO|nr:kinase-like protein [Macroventuria anomochaeta]KAF2633096.1 kinase-like protein [Macroventuria anomochaeta]
MGVMRHLIMTNQSTTFSFTYRNQIAGLSSTSSGLSPGDTGPGRDDPSRSYDALLTIDSLKTVDDLVISLDVLGVPGPLTLHAPFLNKLGEGAQFSVFQGSILEASTNCDFATDIEEVAVKLPLFSTPTERRLDLTSAKSRRQVHDIYLEIMALRNPALQNHRNIVHLIGWGIEETWNETPLLVLELAMGDLCSVLANPDFQITCEITHQLSIDIGHGLDAIHELGIVHGDLKPLNVLVFSNSPHKVPFVAKLADFGLSVNEVHFASDDSVTISGTSEDWCAPEIILGATISASQLTKADNFSYGLMLLSLNCLNGRPPRHKDLDTAIDIVESHQALSSSLCGLLAKALPLLLQANSTKRPSSVKNIMRDSFEACIAWEQDEADRASSVRRRADAPYVHPWRLPPLDAYLFLGLEKSLRRYEVRLTGPQLFAMFLLKSFSEASTDDKSLQMDMLLAAVNKGHIPAQAVVNRVIESYGLPQSLPLSSIKSFLYDGASSGSLLAIGDLFALDPQLASAARHRFQENTGYNQFFSPLTATAISADFLTDTDGNTRLHYFSARGDHQKLAEVLRNLKEPLGLDVKNRYGETPLYKACLIGSWESVELLCQHGANAAIPSFLNGLTCLHWLFNFSAACIDKALTALAESGGNVNALSMPVPNIVDCHFPFNWPAGTPLHFAVHAANFVAIKALLRRGARATIRDGRDPYLSDENVRQMHVHGSAESGESSVPDRPPLGFNAIDLAAAMHKHEVLDSIRTNSQEDTLMASDEEGYTPFHRLSYFRVARTSHGLRFWYPAFRGNSTDSETRLVKTVQALQRMGGDINRLTNTPIRPAIHGVSGLSPLMIAITKADCKTATVLLKSGAHVNGVNRDGRLPILLLPHILDPCVTPNSLLNLTQLLLSYGACVNYRSLDGITPLGAAIASESMPCIKALIKAGADLSVDEQGLNLLARLIYECHHKEWTKGLTERPVQDVVEILRQLDVKESLWVHKVDKDNGSLLHYAAYAGLIECVTMLLDAGLNINQVRKMHFTGSVPSSYSTHAGYMPDGTALDIVELQESKFKSRGQRMLSPEVRLCQTYEVG